MRLAEIDRGDTRGIGGEVGQDVATARCDGHDVTLRCQRHRLHVDLRVFPDLGIDQAAEQPLEQLLQEPLAGHDLMAAHRLLQDRMVLGPRIDQTFDSGSTSTGRR